MARIARRNDYKLLALQDLLLMGIWELSRAIFVCSDLMSPTVQNADDRQLLEVMARENRALLTRDRRLLMHAIVQHGYCPRSQNADEQTIEVVRRFDLSELIAPFTRCLRCNAPLEEAAKADIIDKLEPLTKIYYDQFRRCPDCKQIYWSGSHFPKLQKRIEEIRSRARGKA